MQNDIRSKFSKDFTAYKDFDKYFIANIEKSPHLVELLGRFSGKIVAGANNSGFSYSRTKNEIYIEKNTLTSIMEHPYGPNEGVRLLLTTMGHELGHAVEEPLRKEAKVVGAMTREKYVQSELNGEGIAALQAFRVSKELGVSILNDYEGLKKKLDDVLKKYDGDMKNPDFEKEAIAVGAEHYKTLPTSNTGNNLNFLQYYTTAYAVFYGNHKYEPDQIARIDWRNIKPADVAVRTVMVDGKEMTEFINPRLPGMTKDPVRIASMPEQVIPQAPATAMTDRHIAQLRHAFAPQVGVSPSQTNKIPANTERFPSMTIAAFRENNLRKAEKNFDEKLNDFMNASQAVKNQLTAHATNTRTPLREAAEDVLFPGGTPNQDALLTKPTEAIPLMQAYRQLEEQRKINEPTQEADHSPGPS